MTFTEARRDPHNVARKSFVAVADVEQPATAPRYSRTPGGVRRAPPERGEGGRATLADWGFSAAQVERLVQLGLGSR